MTDPSDIVQQGIVAYKKGDLVLARQLLSRAIQENPDNERAWGWMFNVAENDDQRLFCLQQVLRINPNNSDAKKLINRFMHPPAAAAPLPVSTPILQQPPSPVPYAKQTAKGKTAKSNNPIQNYLIVGVGGFIVCILLICILGALLPDINSISTSTPVAQDPASTLAPPILLTQPAAGDVICSCSDDHYNCPDFSVHAQAQACFNYCIAQGRGDIHKLDNDNDGSACELLP